MKLIAVLLITLCIFTGVNANGFKKHAYTVRHRASIQAMTMMHLDEQEDQQCINAAAQQCFQDVDSSNQAYLAQQVQDLEKWGQSQPSQDEIRAKVQDLLEDSQTGTFWQCVFKGAQACSGGDLVQRITISKVFHNGEAEEQYCLQGLAQQCASTISYADYGYLQQQAQGLEQWGQSQPSQQEIQDKLDELTSDPKTGNFWSCILRGVRACEGGNAIKMMTLQGISNHFSFVHYDDEDAEACVDQAAESCYGDVDEEDQAYLAQQVQDIQDWAESQPSEDEIQAKLEELTSDDRTGGFWTCVVQGAQACDGGNAIRTLTLRRINEHMSFIHADEDEAEACVDQAAESCYDDVDEEDQAYLAQQVQDIQDWAESQPSEDEIQAKLEELTSDERTGGFWTCVVQGAQGCDGGSALRTIQKHVYLLHDEEDDDEIEQCAEDAAQQCIGDVDSGDYGYLQQQAQDLEQWAASQPSLQEIQDKLDELEGDDVTGEFWTCLVEGAQSCDGGELILNPSNLHVSIDQQCAKSELQQCANDVDPSDVGYLKQQFKDLQTFAQSQPGPDAVQAKIQELMGDSRTGTFWTCFFQGLQSCDNGQDELFGQSKSFNMMQVALQKSVHQGVDRACFNKEAQACLSDVDASDMPYLKQQFQDLKSFAQTQPSQDDIQAKIQSLMSDSKTGTFWQCFFNGVRTCDDGQGDINLSFKKLRGKH